MSLCLSFQLVISVEIITNNKVYIYVCVCVRVHVHAYIYIYIYIYIYMERDEAPW